MASSERPLLRFSLGSGVTALAELRPDHAPATVAGILAAAPFQGMAFHAIYSGSEVAMLLPSDVWLPVENATHRVVPGDLGYFRFRGGRWHGFPDDVAEMCWFYDRDATPSMPDGPVAVNLIGRFTDGWEAFAAACRDMRNSGSQPLSIEVA